MYLQSISIIIIFIRRDQVKTQLNREIPFRDRNGNKTT